MAKKKPIGRPATYTKALAEKFCKALSTSEQGIHAICRKEGMPSVTTVYKWLHDEKTKEFTEMYARAREAQSDYMAESILDIADDGRNDLMTVTYGDESYEREDKEVTGRSKLRVDTRKWLMSKLAPKKFGDKLDVTSGDEPLKNFAPQIIVKNVD